MELSAQLSNKAFPCTFPHLKLNPLLNIIYLSFTIPNIVTLARSFLLLLHSNQLLLQSRPWQPPAFPCLLSTSPPKAKPDNYKFTLCTDSLVEIEPAKRGGTILVPLWWRTEASLSSSPVESNKINKTPRILEMFSFRHNFLVLNRRNDQCIVYIQSKCSVDHIMNESC